MRAHQIMTRDVTTVIPGTSIRDTANLMLHCNLSGLPVLDESSALVGIVSQADFIRRFETGTQRKHPRFFDTITGDRLVSPEDLKADARL
ncbi:MAG TPA: CBS domain-containing protein [Bradyrhizobium sp.]|nr:CBS domain-containing protein [Bradyrhizobium sp.]